jgi:F-type H+-transporting ATPase subunit b
LLALLSVPFAAALCLAQHAAQVNEGGAGHASLEILWKWANFLLLAGLLGYFIYKKAGAFFRSRNEAIRKGIEEADRLRREAEQRAAEVEARLHGLEAEIEALRAAARQEMAAEDERLRQAAAAEMEKIQKQAAQQIASAAKAARHEVRAHAAELALEVAASKLRAALTPELDRALAASFLEELDKVRHALPRKESH